MRSVAVSGCAAAMVLATTSGGLACAHSASPRVRSLDRPEAKPGVVNANEVHGIPGRQGEELLEGRVADVSALLCTGHTGPTAPCSSPPRTANEAPGRSDTRPAVPQLP